MSAEVTVRRLRWWDLQRVLPLEREVFPGDPWSAELFWSELGQGASRHYVVAEPSGAGPAVAEPAGAGQEPCPVLAGYAGLLAAGGDADVQTLAVAPAFRGRGVGTLLLGELLTAARRRGCPAVLLEARADNAAALALYARHDFVRLSVRRGYYPDGADGVVMRRRLAAPATAAPS